MARGLQLTFDCTDPHRLAGWWAALLGGKVEDNHDFVAGLLADGVVKEADVVRIDGRLFFADAAAVRDPTGERPRMYFQRVPEPKAAKNRLHLDIPVEAERLDSEVERAVEAGGTFVRFASHPGHRWAVMQDPEGNEFCLH